jgi:hypothetical protein
MALIVLKQAVMKDFAKGSVDGFEHMMSQRLKDGFQQVIIISLLGCKEACSREVLLTGLNAFYDYLFTTYFTTIIFITYIMSPRFNGGFQQAKHIYI